MAATNIGKTKRTTDDLINDAVNRQQSWLNNRRAFTRAFLRRFNVFQEQEEGKKQKKVVKKSNTKQETSNQTTLRAYWFPILCAWIVVLIAVFTMVVRVNNHRAPVRVVVPSVPEPIVKPVARKNNEVNEIIKTPSFDLVRIEKSGNVVVAGRNPSESHISIVINKKIVATENTNANGEFVYAPKTPFAPGNYVISLIDVKNNIKSEDSVFIYVSECGYKNSLSLLMTQNGSRVLQSPELIDGDLVVSKIDYLDTGRIIVTGRALPRLRVTLSLNDKVLGDTRVSDYKNFGLGADVGKLKSGDKYAIDVSLHDDNDTIISTVRHVFEMPEMTGDDDTYYTVRRGDCLWIIARNFLRRGILFTMIAERNDILNPDLIFPKQLLQIPVVK